MPACANSHRQDRVLVLLPAVQEDVTEQSNVSVACAACRSEESTVTTIGMDSHHAHLPERCCEPRDQAHQRLNQVCALWCGGAFGSAVACGYCHVLPPLLFRGRSGRWKHDTVGEDYVNSSFTCAPNQRFLLLRTARHARRLGSLRHFAVRCQRFGVLGVGGRVLNRTLPATRHTSQCKQGLSTALLDRREHGI